MKKTEKTKKKLGKNERIMKTFDVINVHIYIYIDLYMYMYINVLIK